MDLKALVSAWIDLQTKSILCARPQEDSSGLRSRLRRPTLFGLELLCYLHDLKVYIAILFQDSNLKRSLFIRMDWNKSQNDFSVAKRKLLFSFLPEYSLLSLFSLFSLLSQSVTRKYMKWFTERQNRSKSYSGLWPYVIQTGIMLKVFNWICSISYSCYFHIFCYTILSTQWSK